MRLEEKPPIFFSLIATNRKGIFIKNSKTNLERTIN